MQVTLNSYPSIHQLLLTLLSHYTVVWGYLVYCVFVFFFCLYGYGFLSSGKDREVKFCMHVLTTIRTGLLTFW